MARALIVGHRRDGWHVGDSRRGPQDLRQGCPREVSRGGVPQRGDRRALIEQAFESGTIALPGGGRMVAGASVERPRPRKVRAPQSRLAGNARPP